MARPKSLVECQKELHDNIPKLRLSTNELHLKFYAAASHVLLSTEDVDGGLKWLNTLMEQKLESRVGKGALAEKKEEFVKYYAADSTRETKVQDFRKLLTETLTDFERQIGYVDKIPSLLRELSGPEFGNVLRAGAHWKDPGAGVQHGEFTHRIQWFLVVTSAKLKGSGISSFKALTEITQFSTGTKAEREGRDIDFIPLWTVLFDRGIDFFDHEANATNRVKMACDMEDFRCPEFLHPRIIDPTNRSKWPLLGAFLYARTQKRENFLAPAMRLQYIVKKLDIPAPTAEQYAKELEGKKDTKEQNAFLKSVLDKHGVTGGVL